MSLYSYLRKRGLYIDNIDQSTHRNDESERLQRRYNQMTQVKARWYSEQPKEVKDALKKYV